MENRSALPTLTTQQHRVLNAIENFIDGHGQPPSVRELMRIVGKEKTTTEDHLRRLAVLGFIYREPGRHRAIRVLIPSAGVVIKDQPIGLAKAYPRPAASCVGVAADRKVVGR